MEVSGFRLPAAFVQLCEAIRRDEAPDEWGLKEDVDAYGRPWEVADLRIKGDPEEIQSDTDWMSNAFLHEGRLPQLPGYADQPGFIADFTGVANFVPFAHSTSGETYAFDFRTDLKEPSVVYWDEYWRRVAPNFADFMALFVDVRKSPKWQKQMQWLMGDEDDEE